tara:strand:- start:1841 stop:2914 length:1074 start_codon:yes stop_codon:yes gene_type:complete
MKWIGQHIWDFVSRFRNDVYLEDISTDTIVSGGNLGLDANNKVVKATVASGGGVYKRDDATYPTTVAEFTQSGTTYDFVLTNYSTDRQRLFTLSEDQTGIFYEELTRSTQLTFNVSSFVLQNSSGNTISTSSVEIGASSSKWEEDCQGFNANYNNVAGSSLSGTNQIAVENRSSNQGWGSSALTIETSDLSGSSPQVLADFRDGAAAVDFDVYYPNDTSWSSGKKTLKFTLTANDGSSAESTASITFNFQNRIFYGTSANSSLSSAQIIALANEPFAGTNFLLSETSISTSGAQYIYYCYPSRLSGTPVFKLGGFNTDFNSLTDVEVTNGSEYVEDYKVYRSNLQFTDASSTLQVTT